jgi:hypothetical protein
MNSPFAAQQARALSQRTERIPAAEERVKELYRLTFARAAGPEELKRGVDFIKTLEALPVEAALAPIWSYGSAHFDPQTRLLSSFVALPHFTGKSWQGGAKMPDPKLGFAHLNANGGHPGGTHDLAVVRRFTAPSDGTYRFNGTLHRAATAGDGVRGLVVANGTQVVGDWTVVSGESVTAGENIELKAGQTLDFILDCGGNENSDGFQWAPVVRRSEGGEWEAKGIFGGPVGPKAKPMSPWERYSQTLLMANEFVFID